MMLRMFSLNDKKTSIYHPPIYAHNEQDAMRMIMNIMQNEQTNIHRYPEDFDLYEVGSFDDQTAKVEGDIDKHFICNVREMLGRKDANK